jgi:hypothetical protein
MLFADVRTHAIAGMGHTPALHTVHTINNNLLPHITAAKKQHTLILIEKATLQSFFYVVVCIW